MSDLAGSAVSATLTHDGLGDQFRLVFFRDDDQLYLSTPGAGKLFPNCDIHDLVERLERVLVAMAADPTQRLSSMDLLGVGEHARLDGVGNRAVLTEPAVPAMSIPVLFAAQVARAPEAVAVTFDGRSLTYRELDEAADRLAHLLAGQGAGPGQCVALLFTRSAEAIRVDSGGARRRGRPMCRSTRRSRRRGSGSWWLMPRRSPRSPRPGLRPRLDACDLPVIDVDDPRIDSQPMHSVAGAGCRMTLRT